MSWKREWIIDSYMPSCSIFYIYGTYLVWNYSKYNMQYLYNIKVFFNTIVTDILLRLIRSLRHRYCIHIKEHLKQPFANIYLWETNITMNICGIRYVWRLCSLIRRLFEERDSSVKFIYLFKTMVYFPSKIIPKRSVF